MASYTATVVVQVRYGDRGEVEQGELISCHSSTLNLLNRMTACGEALRMTIDEWRLEAESQGVVDDLPNRR
ncbi:MAG: hypothetical protein HP492_14230 [Nitrospira sp.]|nr:hypothetical protein [Nitrospira sp.]